MTTRPSPANRPSNQATKQPSNYTTKERTVVACYGDRTPTKQTCREVWFTSRVVGHTERTTQPIQPTQPHNKRNYHNPQQVGASPSSLIDRYRCVVVAVVHHCRFVVVVVFGWSAVVGRSSFVVVAKQRTKRRTKRRTNERTNDERPE